MTTFERRHKKRKSTQIHSPAWRDPLGINELKRAEELYGVCARDLKELAELVEKADHIFVNCLSPDGPGSLPDEEEWLICTFANEQRHICYVLGRGGENLPQHSCELKQSRDTYKPVMQILYSAVKLKPDLERAAGAGRAHRLFNDLENTLRFILWPQDPEAFTNTSSDHVIRGTVVSTSVGKAPTPSPIGILWLYAGNNPEEDKRHAENLIAELQQLQERLVSGFNASAGPPATLKNIGESNRSPLSKKAQLIYEKLKSLPEHEAMTLPAIQHWFEVECRHGSLDTGTWKKIRKQLLLYGLQNKPKVGYFLKK
jgi:hypothetical protein